MNITELTAKFGHNAIAIMKGAGLYQAFFGPK